MKFKQKRERQADRMSGLSQVAAGPIIGQPENVAEPKTCYQVILFSDALEQVQFARLTTAEDGSILKRLPDLRLGSLFRNNLQHAGGNDVHSQAE